MNVDIYLAGLWSIVDSHQYSPWLENHQMWLTSVDGVYHNMLSWKRVELFMSTSRFLKTVAKIAGRTSLCQLVVDSKYLLMHNNYPITVVGLLDAGLQLHVLETAITYN